MTLSFSRISKKTGLPKNKNWMNHLRVPQRQLERLQLARMESRNRFLRNPRFFPPNTPLGGKSLLFPPKKPARVGAFQDGELEERCVFSGLVFSETRTLQRKAQKAGRGSALASGGSPRFGAWGSGSESSRASGLPAGVALGHPQSPGFVLF